VYYTRPNSSEQPSFLGAAALIQMIDKIEEHSHKVVLEMTEERFEKRVAQVGAARETKISDVNATLETKIADVKTTIQLEV
jgi:hypothetical protein